MKKNILSFIIIIIVIISAIFLYRLNSKNEDVSAPKVESHVNSLKITKDDEDQVRILLTDFYKSLESGSYEKAWNCMSKEYKSQYPKNEAVNNHWYIERIKFNSVKPYIFDDSGVNTNIPDGTYTTDFTVDCELKQTNNMPMFRDIWGFPMVEKEQGKWVIKGFATTP